MDYEKGVDGSFLHNCFINRRESDSSKYLFHNSITVSAFLNGYAIIPIEKYARLIELAGPNGVGLKPVTYSMEEIREADKQLHGKE